MSSAFHQDIRFTQSADGTRLAYAVHGAGFPLVRAAHWLTNIDLDWQTPMWRPWFDALGARYRFHRYDSRGCGLSDRQSIDASLDSDMVPRSSGLLLVYGVLITSVPVGTVTWMFDVLVHCEPGWAQAPTCGF